LEEEGDEGADGCVEVGGGTQVKVAAGDGDDDGGVAGLEEGRGGFEEEVEVWV